MNSDIVVQIPFIPKRNIGVRIPQKTTLKDWTQNQCTIVLFSDESSFSVCPTENRLKFWPYRGCRLRHRHAFEYGYLISPVWDSFSTHRHTALVGKFRSVDQNTYRSIINELILPFINNIYDGTDRFILQDENYGLYRPD